MENRRTGLLDRLAAYDSLTEVGIGRRTDVAAALSERGVDVAATDVRDVDVPDGVRFVVDDVVARSVAPAVPAVYRSEAVYALNLPPELHRPTADVARRVGADFLFTTLGFDEPAIPVRRVSLRGETLYVRTADSESEP